MSSSFAIPSKTRAVVVRKLEKKMKDSSYVNGAVLESLPIPKLAPGQILVKIGAVAFNHRDVWIRKGMYPDIGFGRVFGSDGAGTVVASGDTDDPILNQRVFLAPTHGWDKHPDTPESVFSGIGGVRWPALGTFAEYVAVDKDKVILSAPHLNDTHMAAWPVAGLTAWRATMVNAGVQPGHNVLITGIGGGVALAALQLCVAQEASVYVTSGSQEKIDKAIHLGAKGGANYKDKDWPKTIQAHLKQQHSGSSSSTLDSVVDSGGGDIMGLVGPFLKQGGRVVCYGMTANPKITFTMREVLRNQKLLGSTMGSTQDLRDATVFLSNHKLVPVVSHVFPGLESAEQGFEMLRSGEQFGKVVLKVGNADAEEKEKIQGARGVSAKL